MIFFILGVFTALSVISDQLTELNVMAAIGLVLTGITAWFFEAK